MVPVAYLDFEETTGITGPITKFGGKPWGLRQEDWPRSAKKQEQLEFIAQIVLEPHIFPNAEQQIAYVFWDTKQLSSYQGVVLIRKRSELFDSAAEGPAIHKVVLGQRRFLFREKIKVPVEFKVQLRLSAEPSLTDFDIMIDEDNPESDRKLHAHQLAIDGLVKKIDVAKIGGIPHYIQDPEAKNPTDRLLLHLPWSRFPFDMALGDAGTFFAFINADLSEGYGFWQCY